MSWKMIENVILSSKVLNINKEKKEGRVYAYEYKYSCLSGLNFYKYLINAIPTEVCQIQPSLQCHSVESLSFSILIY